MAMKRCISAGPAERSRSGFAGRRSKFLRRSRMDRSKSSNRVALLVEVVLDDDALVAEPLVGGVVQPEQLFEHVLVVLTQRGSPAPPYLRQPLERVADVGVGAGVDRRQRAQPSPLDHVRVRDQQLLD